jgi:hypothetical protein
VAPPMSGPPVAPPMSGPPVVPPAPEPRVAPPAGAVPPSGSAPPAWPPVSDREANPPTVPESLAAALDMTAELPRYRPDHATDGANGADGSGGSGEGAPEGVLPQSPAPSAGQSPTRPPAPDRPPTEAQRAAAAAAAAHEAAAAQAAEAQATAAAQIAAAQAARQRDMQGQYGDETMELPIFRELESAWFTTARPHSDTARPPAPSAVPDDDSSAATTQRFSAGVPQQASSPESMDGDEYRERDAATVGATANPWHTAADEGWQAARAAAERSVDNTTTAGLPKRTPMAQLVPGGVDRGGNTVSRRTPETVRGLLSAYHRGVQRGRQSTNPEETPGGQQSSQAGKEHEA